MGNGLLAFSQDDIDKVIEKIWQREGIKNSNFPTPVDNPKAFIWGGPPGAGKSSSMSKVSKEYLNDNSFVISGDDYRKYHPNFEEIVKAFGDEWSLKTSEWSAAIFDEIFDRASNLNYNVQIEGTMRTAHLPLKTADMLLQKGYNVNFAVALAPKELCVESTVERYERQKEQGQIPRAVDQSYINDFFKSFSQNVVEVFNAEKHNQFLLYARYKDIAPEKVYSNLKDKPLEQSFIDRILDTQHSKEYLEDDVNVNFQALSDTVARLGDVPTLSYSSENSRMYGASATFQRFIEEKGEQGERSEKINWMHSKVIPTVTFDRKDLETLKEALLKIDNHQSSLIEKAVNRYNALKQKVLNVKDEVAKVVTSKNKHIVGQADKRVKDNVPRKGRGR